MVHGVWLAIINIHLVAKTQEKIKVLVTEIHYEKHHINGLFFKFLFYSGGKIIMLILLKIECDLCGQCPIKPTISENLHLQC